MEKTIILVGIYNQQFQGTISIMIFDFRVCISVYFISIGELIYLEPNDDSIFEGKFLKTNAEIPTKSFGFQVYVYIGKYIYIFIYNVSCYFNFRSLEATCGMSWVTSLLQKPFQQNIHPSDRSTRQQPFQKTCLTAAPWHFRVRTFLDFSGLYQQVFFPP